MNIKKITLFVSLFSLLLLGQGSAATVSSVSLNSFNDGTGYSLDIWWVGTSTADQDEITLSADGTYDIVSTSGIQLLNVKVNLTGFSSWTDGSAYQNTVGQLDIFVDGNHFIAAAGFAGSTGAVVTLVGEGDHTVSYLYSNMGQDGTFYYATDSITVRMRTTNSFAAYKTTTFPVSYGVTDSATAGQNISRMHIFEQWNDFWYVYDFGKNATLDPKNDVVVDIIAQDDGTRTVDFAGAIDTTGSQDRATQEWVESTVGRVFLLDATGLHLYSGGAMDLTLRAEDALTSTYLGIFVQGDAGIFFEDDDMESMTGTVGDTEFGASFDFLGTLAGASFGNIPSVTVTSTVSSQTTSTTTVESPGFSGFEALLGLLSLGTIAFLIPRRFRK